MINTQRAQLAHVESKQYLAKCKMSVDLHEMWVNLEDKQEKNKFRAVKRTKAKEGGTF